MTRLVLLLALFCLLLAWRKRPVGWYNDPTWTSEARNVTFAGGGW